MTPSGSGRFQAGSAKASRVNSLVAGGTTAMKARLIPMEGDSIETAARVVRQGGLIAYPTDTVYGLGCDPFNHAAVRRLFEAKGRGPKPAPVLCGSAEKAAELVKLEGRALELASSHWPGALTIVAPLRSKVAPELTQGKPYLGVRVPDHPGCLRLITSCGGWLTGTSANLSGHPSSRSAAETMDQLGGAVDVVLDGGRLDGSESTVVRVEGGEVTILRTGPVGVGNEVKGGRIS